MVLGGGGTVLGGSGMNLGGGGWTLGKIRTGSIVHDNILSMIEYIWPMSSSLSILNCGGIPIALIIFIKSVGVVSRRRFFLVEMSLRTWSGRIIQGSVSGMSRHFHVMLR